VRLLQIDDLSLIFVTCFAREEDMVRCIVLLVDLWIPLIRGLDLSIPLTKGLTGAFLSRSTHAAETEIYSASSEGGIFSQRDSLISLVRHLPLVKHMLQIHFRLHRLLVSFCWLFFWICCYREHIYCMRFSFYSSSWLPGPTQTREGCRACSW